MYRYFAGWFAMTAAYAAVAVLLLHSISGSYLYPEALSAVGIGFFIMSVSYVCRMYDFEQEVKCVLESIGDVRFRSSGTFKREGCNKERCVGAMAGSEGVVFMSGDVFVSSVSYTSGVCLSKDLLEFIDDDGRKISFRPDNLVGLAAFEQVLRECDVAVRRPDY